MRSVRPAIALDPMLFGRKEPASDRLLANADVRLFLTTFAAGFLFVSVLIA